MSLALLLALLGPQLSRALVIAFNESDVPSTQALRFADDDGFRWRETLERLGVETILLTIPDADTARVEAGRGMLPEAPSWQGVRNAVTRIAEANRKSPGDVIVVYVGHGQIGGDGKPYLTLLDARLDQQRLYSEVVDALGAPYVHLIIDACHAAGVVGSRGSDGSLIAELKVMLAKEQLKSRPTVGVMFAESETGETHEWSNIRSGVFSHAARSGLMGGADVNGDGQIGYSELDAFVTSAISGVKGSRSRLMVRTAAPQLDPTRKLVGPAPDGPSLSVPDTQSFARLSIEDGDGVRLVDIHRAAGERVALSLPERATYWLRTAAGASRVRRAELTQTRFVFVAPEVGQRGDAEEGFARGLFAMSFGRAFYEGFIATSDAPSVTFRAPPPDVPKASLRDDGAWLNLGVSFGLPVIISPLGTRGLGTGANLAWRSAGNWYFGARAQWTLAPSVFDGAAGHRGAVGPVVGFRPSWLISPFIEAGPQWAPQLVVRARTTQGDWLIFGGRVAVGAQGSTALLRGLRLGASLDVEGVRIDGAYRAVVIPGLELAVTL